MGDTPRCACPPPIPLSFETHPLRCQNCGGVAEEILQGDVVTFAPAPEVGPEINVVIRRRDAGDTSKNDWRSEPGFRALWDDLMRRAGG